MLAGELGQPLAGLCAAVFLADDVHEAVAEEVAELVEGNHLAAALEPRIDRQQAAASHRLLQEQLAEVADEDLDGVLFGLLGQLAAELALPARDDQALVCILAGVEDER